MSFLTAASPDMTSLVLKLPTEAGAAAHAPARTNWRTPAGEPLQTQTGSISLCRPGIELQNVDEDIRKKKKRKIPPQTAFQSRKSGFTVAALK